MELLDVFDEDNNYLGYSLDRSEVHNKNLWHHHVSAWIMNFGGKVLLQKRALIKKKNPGKWAKTGGHVDAGETPLEAIKREVYEEIGLLLNDDELEKVEIFKSVLDDDHYYSYGYILFTNLKEEEFKLQKEEVCMVKCFEIEELEKIKREKDSNYTFYKWDDESFNKQIKMLKEYRNKVLNKQKREDII